MTPEDHISGNLDATCTQLAMYLEIWNIFEPSGSRIYTYQHPSMKDRKSCIDQIYVPKDLCQQTYTYSQWTSLSDHIMVIMAPNKKYSGPSQWHIPDDVIKLQKTEAMIQDLVNKLSLTNFSPEMKLEICKQEIRSWCQQFTKFRCKQHQIEMCILCIALRTINNRIYRGEDLECDQLKLKIKFLN